MKAERRKTVRREQDRRLLEQLERAGTGRGSDTSHEHRHLRRRAIRHNCQVKMALRVGANFGGSDTWTLSEHPLPGRLLDLSIDGCSVFSAQQLDIGAQLSVKIDMHREGLIQSVCVVRWSKAVPEHHGYATGLQFGEISPANRERVRAFIQRMDATIGL